MVAARPAMAWRILVTSLRAPADAVFWVSVYPAFLHLGAWRSFDLTVFDPEFVAWTGLTVAVIDRRSVIAQVFGFGPIAVLSAGVLLEVAPL